MQQAITCPSCGSQNPEDQQFCGACGTKLPTETPEMAGCPNCGAQNPPGQQFCGACGGRMSVGTVPQVITCPRCGVQNAPGQQFCGACGMRLATAAQRVAQTTAVVPRGPVGFQGVEVRPTWGLAWGLYWRMLVLGLLVSVVVGILTYLVMMILVAAGWKMPWF